MIFKKPKCPICGALCVRTQRKVKDGYDVVIFCPMIIHEIPMQRGTLYTTFNGGCFDKSKEKARWKARQRAFHSLWRAIND